MKPSDGKVPYDKALRPVRTPGQLGDWATIAVLALAASLWGLWPSQPPRRRNNWQLPEPSCAYGVLSPSSAAGNVLGRFAAPTGKADALAPFARLPTIEAPPIPEPVTSHHATISPPAYAGSPWQESAFLVPPPAFPYRIPTAAATGVVVNASAPLRAAAFTFDIPPVTNAAPFSLRAILAFDLQGNVETLLIDAFSGHDSLLVPWRTALQFAHAATNAVGTVEISFLAQPVGQNTGDPIPEAIKRHEVIMTDKPQWQPLPSL